MATLVLSYWNPCRGFYGLSTSTRGEPGVEAGALPRAMLGEFRVLARMWSAVVVGVS